MQVSPYLVYEDAPAAIDFLCRAFGFEERFRYPMPDGSIGHAELVAGDAVVMLASVFEAMGFASPHRLAGVHCQMHCTVDDVDTHHERARAAGATIAAQPADQDHGHRIYRAIDPEGHRWIFSQPLPEIR